ncbi:MAG: DUF1015 domain-containing protein [Methanoregula sp.]|uniref:DUF1015 domain-containing protein n=1 Tax=Methanoregula sp. TaxID=2052170 RepID=UPI003C775D3C
MVTIYRFAAVRPTPADAQSIAAVPYDVVTADEARAIIRENPDSFLTVSRSDAELPDLSPHDDRVYDRARDNFTALQESGRMRKDERLSMYIYRIQQDGEIFIGLCCCLDVEDYRRNNIRRHEQTRYDKEEDRTRHIDAVKAHDGPVVLLYQDAGDLFCFIETLIAGQKTPDAEVHTPGGSIHQIFRITEPQVLDGLEHRFRKIQNLYIADGHHRAKAAVNLANRKRAAGLPVDGEISRFMGVLFAHDRVRIHGYSRLLADLGPYTPETFLSGLRKRYTVNPYGHVDGSGYNIRPHIASPENYHIMHLYLEGTWYECCRPVDKDAGSIDVLDVAVLQKHVLEEMLGITDPRGDARLQYLGGARPVSDLEKLVDAGTYRLAFAMQPVRVGTVLSIANAGGIMPPKSTWFEPKLLSGLVIHSFV